MKKWSVGFLVSVMLFATGCIVVTRTSTQSQVTSRVNGDGSITTLIAGDPFVAGIEMEPTPSVMKEYDVSLSPGEYSGIQVDLDILLEPVIKRSLTDQLEIKVRVAAQTEAEVDTAFAELEVRTVDGQLKVSSLNPPKCEAVQLTDTTGFQVRAVKGVCILGVEVSIPEPSHTEVFLKGVMLFASVVNPPVQIAQVKSSLNHVSGDRLKVDVLKDAKSYMSESTLEEVLELTRGIESDLYRKNALAELSPLVKSVSSEGIIAVARSFDSDLYRKDATILFVDRVAEFDGSDWVSIAKTFDSDIFRTNLVEELVPSSRRIDYDELTRILAVFSSDHFRLEALEHLSTKLDRVGDLEAMIRSFDSPFYREKAREILAD